MKIVFSIPAEKGAAIPSHEFYTPGQAFADKHKLSVEEAETWVSLYRSSAPDNKSISFNKETGELTMEVFEEWADEGGAIFKNLFCGYLPDEQAFEAVLSYTGWLER